MAAWFGSKKDKEEAPAAAVSADAEAAEAAERITVTDLAREKIAQLIGNAVSPVSGVRVVAEATTPVNPQFSLAFVQEGEAYDDDTVIQFPEFSVYIDPASLEYVENVRLDFVQMGAGGGFKIEKNRPVIKIEGEVAQKIQQVIEQHINPAIASHGGIVSLLDVQGDTAYIKMGGGCQGCGMADVTLKQGIETTIREHVPEITRILDTTDHASGTNPYYRA